MYQNILQKNLGMVQVHKKEANLTCSHSQELLFCWKQIE